MTAAKAYDRAAIDRRNFALYKREQSGGEMTFNKAILHPFLNFEHESGCSVCHVLTPNGREERKMREANGKEMNGGDIDGNAAHNPRNPWDRAGCVTPPTGANVDGDLVSAKTNTNSSGDEAYVSPVTFVKNEKLELICGNGASGYANAKRFRNDYLESKMTAMEEGSYSFKEEKEEGGKDKKSNKKAGKKKNGKKSKKKKGVCTSEEEVEGELFCFAFSSNVSKSGKTNTTMMNFMHQNTTRFPPKPHIATSIHPHYPQFRISQTLTRTWRFPSMEKC